MGSSARHKNRVVKYAVQRGLEVSQSKSGHLKIYDGKRLVAVASMTPSDPHAWKNYTKQIDRYLKGKENQ